MIIRYRAGGWVAPGTSVSWQRNDNGKDFVIPWGHVLQAPGNGHCVENGSDKPFPNGFGPKFAIVRIDTGQFAGHDWYLGHCTSLLAPGEHFAFGHPLACSNQGHPSQIGINVPGNGGWVELGTFANGRCGVSGPSGHWFDQRLMKDLQVRIPDPPLKFGDKGPNILLMSWRLQKLGYLSRRYWTFNRPVHGAVIAFQRDHRIPQTGQVGARTWVAIRQAHKK